MAYVKCSDEVHARLKVYAAERTGAKMQDLADKWLMEGMSGASESPLDGLTASQRKMVETIIHAAREGIKPEMMQVIEVAVAAIRREMADSERKTRKAG